MKYFLYILRSKQSETYYTGISDSPERRLEYHNGESKGYTRKYRPWQIVYSQPFKTEEQALAAERKVKHWKSKKMIRLLVKGQIDIREYL